MCLSIDSNMKYIARYLVMQKSEKRKVQEKDEEKNNKKYRKSSQIERLGLWFIVRVSSVQYLFFIFVLFVFLLLSSRAG